MIYPLRYVTISILKEKLKNYLRKICNEVRELRARIALEELRHILSDDELEKILESSKEFREKFKFR